ncbi:hypothetical protein ACU4HD_48105 [Cupriavidus basilensis]
MLGLTVAVVGLSSVRTCFYSIPATFLDKQAAAGGLACINSVGSLGGLFGPYMVGWLKRRHRLVQGRADRHGRPMLVLATLLSLVLLSRVKEGQR